MTITHVQREVELSSPELPMMERVPKQQYVEIRPKSFQNDDSINDQLDNIGTFLVKLQPIYPLHSIL